MTMIVIAASAPGPLAATGTLPAAAPAKTLATARAIGLRLCLIDLECAAAEFGSVQRRNRLLGFSGISHFDKGESPRPAGFTVGDHADSFHRSVRLEQVS
jgi:hypothetical protein